MAKKARSLDDIKLEDDDITELSMEEIAKPTDNDPVVEGSVDHDPVATAKRPKAEAAAVDVLNLSIDRQVTQLGRKTASLLRSYEKEKILIPVDKLNKHDSYVVAGINGWNFQIQRGVPVELPKPVVSLLINAGYGPTLVR